MSANNQTVRVLKRLKIQQLTIFYKAYNWYYKRRNLSWQSNILTGSAKEKPEVAEVIAVGPGKKDVTMGVNKGDKVLISKYSGTNVKLDGEEFIIVKMDDILAVVD